MQEDDQDVQPLHIEAGDLTLCQPLAEEAQGQPSQEMRATGLTLSQPLVEEAKVQPSSQFYVIDDDDFEEEPDPLIPTSFQPSVSMPRLSQTVQAPEIAPESISKTNKGRRRILTIGVIGLLVLVVLGFLSITVFAHPMMEQLVAFKGARSASSALQFVPPTPTPNNSLLVPPHHVPTTTNMMPDDLQKWIPQPLVKEWTNAGLVGADAVEAARTAQTFTDREEAIDFRSVGTRTKHGGTLTSATFVLSRGGQLRFQTADVRVVNNTLFDQVQQRKLIQAAVNLVPHVVQIKVQGHVFVWIDVTFQLFQSQLDAQNHRVEGLEMDTAQKKPRVHHMSVGLLRVTPSTQGAMAPMGGTGWLVSVYGRDLSTPPAIQEPV